MGGAVFVKFLSCLFGSEEKFDIVSTLSVFLSCLFGSEGTVDHDFCDG